MATKTKVGIIGSGMIAPAYIKGCRGFHNVEVVACSDLSLERAQTLAAEYDLEAMTTDDLLASDVDIVINLTIPAAHTEVSLAAIAAGKHVHSEKPLALTREDGQKILQAADAAGVRVGCAPDTFLGGGLQTCIKLIDDGWIGRPIGASAFFATRGPESWHTNPGFFYQVGGGPVLDMGPYYLTALVTLIGPVKQVAAITGRAFEERIATSEMHYGKRLPVEVSTLATGVLQFANGAIGSLTLSFDIWAHHQPRIEIYGTEGTLSVPDPNTFGGPVRVFRPSDGEWRDVPLTHPADVGRGIGVADMDAAIQSGRPHRASGALAYHVLDLMLSLDDASERNEHIIIDSFVERPAPLPVDLLPGELDS